MTEPPYYKKLLNIMISTVKQMMSNFLPRCIVKVDGRPSGVFVPAYACTRAP